MTRVLQAIAGAPHGGAEAFFTRLAIALQGAGLEQKVLIRHDPERADLLRRSGVDVTELSFGGRLDIITPLRFRYGVSQFKPDVVLTWMNRATRFAPVSSQKNPFVHVARLGGFYNLKYYQACDHLIGNTKGVVNYLKKSGRSESQIHYLPNFVEDKPSPPELRSVHTTPGESPLILALGRLHENKGFDTLIQAITEIPHAYLWIAGEGPLRSELEELSVRVGVRPRVRFLGWRDDTASLFAAADMLVCPSRHEPLGNVVLEGWAHNCPVLATASDGPSELIRQDKNGVLVPIDEPRAMAEAIKRFLRNPGLLRELARSGRKSFETHFTEEKVVARYMKFFRKVAL